jgi:signal transduction histidine kinase
MEAISATPEDGVPVPIEATGEFDRRCRSLEQLNTLLTAEIVREHQGRFESDEGCGSTFRVVLPAAKSAA